MKCKASTSWAIFSGRGGRGSRGQLEKYLRPNSHSFHPASRSCSGTEALTGTGSHASATAILPTRDLPSMDFSLELRSKIERLLIIPSSWSVLGSISSCSFPAHYKHQRGHGAICERRDLQPHCESNIFARVSFDSWMKCFVTPGAAPAVGEGLG